MIYPKLRFTLRSLAVLVTLICVYLGSWDATKRWGLDEVDAYHVDVGYANGYEHNPKIESSFPCLVTLRYYGAFPGDGVVPDDLPEVELGYVQECKYLWFFGCIIELKNTLIERRHLPPYNE